MNNLKEQDKSGDGTKDRIITFCNEKIGKQITNRDHLFYIIKLSILNYLI